MKATIFICACLITLSGCQLGRNDCRNERQIRPTAPHGILFVDNTHNHPETGEGIPHAKQKGLNLFAYEGMAGIIEYVPWSTLERKPGEFHFSGILGLLRQARDHKKKLAFGVICGSHMPAWYRDAHPEQEFHYRIVQRRKDVGTIERDTYAILPWIETDNGLALNECYFDAFNTLMRELARAIGDADLTQHLMYVAITGPGGGNALEVQWAMPLYEDWQRFDFSPEKQELWIQSWKRCAQIIATHFPQTPRALAVTDQYGAQPQSTRENVKHARNVALSKRVLDAVMEGQTPGQQSVFPMGLWLSHWNRWGENAHPLCKLLQDKRKMGFKIGLQGHLIRHRDLAALEKETIAKGIEAQASWIELWHKDIFKPGFEQIPPKYTDHFPAE